jgi:hypothetical protein
MTFLDELRRELHARGIRGRLAARIEAELADHLACDPDARLGEPAEIAERFSVELRTVLTRRASIRAFAALAFCALLLFAASAGIVGAGGYPASTGGLVPLSGLAMIACAQIAFVAGVLALVRALRAGSPGDLRLAQRRTLVAVDAGLGLAAALAVHAAAVRPMPLWWHAVTLTLAAAMVPGLLVAAAGTRRAAVLTPGGDAAGLGGDLPAPLRGRPGLVLAALGAAAVAVATLQGTIFEGSPTEGLVRGGLEAAGLLAGVALLGRLLGLRGNR